MTASKQTVTIDLAGAKYRMTSDADAGHLQRLAELVNERIDGLGAKAARTASPAQLLAVVALGLADELVEESGRRKQVEELTRDTLQGAIARIDKRLTQS